MRIRVVDSLRQLAVAVIATLVILAVGGCGTSTPPQPPAAAAADINPRPTDQLAEGGELRIAVPNLAGTWNPLHSQQLTSDRDQLRRAFLPSLFNVDEAGVLTPNPNFVRSAEVSAGPPARVTISLHERAVWSDGEQITAADAIATWKACNGTRPEFNCARGLGFEAITDVVQGATTRDIQITYAGSATDWQRPWAAGLLRAESVVDPATFNDGWSTVRPEWTSGPFVPEGQDTKAISLVPQLRWWGPPPRLSRISVRALDAAAGSDGFGNYTVDVLQITDAQTEDRVRGLPGTAVRMAMSGDYRRLIFNTTAGPLADQRVRQAIVLSVDPQAISQTAFSGTGYPAQAMNSQFYGRHQAQWVDTASPAGMNLNRDKAKKILTDGGWDPGADGVRQRDGQPLVVRTTRFPDSLTSEAESMELQRQLATVGIAVQIEDAQPGQLADSSLLASGNFGIIGVTESSSPFPLADLPARFGTGGARNWSRLSMPPADQLITQIDGAADPATRVDLSHKLEAILWSESPGMPLYQLPQLTGERSVAANLGAPGQGTIDWTLVGLIAG